MIEVESYNLSDYESVIRLYKNKQAYGGNFDELRDEADRLQATADAGNLFVSRVDGEILGTFMILDNPHSFWLLRFAVDPDSPNSQAVADALAARATEIARERSHHSVIVYADTDDEKLNERYRQSGFNKAGNYRCYWKAVS
jgi:hypothetical protein